MENLFLLTGSNIGNSAQHLQQAKQFINERIGITVKSSSVYKTEPWGKKDQQDFLNQVLLVQTKLLAEDALIQLLQIEKEMGRNRLQKWEPRIIDIDILFYGDRIINTEKLIVPHPLLHERRFTLLPLAEIAAGYMHPVLHKTIEELLQSCNDTSAVTQC
ncbi:2-amino-4-hydroxy-6-hydroxymethyldihydropteridine pyrophosphokinase [Bacteroidetes bacterium UKL13-3]|jgi:2-amino-4-hydroxy-6-hydroxymethyldihydropteridine diphosphokinase|nr:2-amino-4-hydroxy-6-hydroxymethyldihydropteridine pyrophosphokinase [Bacteroidetes bacterium UKL13-3]HCP93265.1 2-amino-4-hydroxy-6-hydroxymethyldihydropteridine diphosphokinase [Bacteroidota bacterium]